MTEPKYKIGQMVKWSNKGKYEYSTITAIIRRRIGICYDSDNKESLIEETDILHAIKIIPDYGEVYCKDCKHFRIAYENENPIFEGCMCLDELMGNFHMMNWRFDPYFSGDTLQPPPNCSCFEPKEAK